MKNETFKGVGGLDIFTCSWRPEGKRPRAAVVIVHGFNSHSRYYDWTAEQLVARAGSALAFPGERDIPAPAAISAA